MKEFKPFVPAEATLREFTPFPLIMGALLGIVFGASSLYLALKVGVTVSASIPAAVLSITLFKGLSRAFGLRRATILENNLVQTTGSAGESIAFGVAVTMPALLIMGYDLDVGRIITVAILGGAIGVLMMIPLRRALIVHEHETLTYPEGTACAEVLIVGERGGSSGKIVFGGFFLGLFYKFGNVGLKLFKDVPEKAFAFFKGSAIAAEISPELLGVGYIIGIRTASVMLAGGRSVELRADPDDRVVRIGLSRALVSGQGVDQGHGHSRHLAQLRPVHRRGLGGGGRTYLVVRKPADHRARRARGPQDRDEWRRSQGRDARCGPRMICTARSSSSARSSWCWACGRRRFCTSICSRPS